MWQETRRRFEANEGSSVDEGNERKLGVAWHPGGLPGAGEMAFRSH